MNIDLVVLKQAAQAATPGEWRYFPKRKYNEHHVSVPIQGCGMHQAMFPHGCPTDRPKEDAEYIAAAQPKVMLELIAELERVQAAKERAVTTIRKLERDAMQVVAGLVYEAGGKATISAGTMMLMPHLVLTQVARPDLPGGPVEFSVSKQVAQEEYAAPGEPEGQ